MRKDRLSVFLTFFVVVGCADDPTPTMSTETDFLGPGQVATVDGHRIAESVLEVLSQATIQRPASELNEDERTLLVEQLISMRLLAEEARERRLTETQPVAAELEYRQTELLARVMVETFREENAPTEAELRRAYEANLARLSGTQYKARHILVETEQEAAGLIDELDSGADFASLAREHSTGPTGPNGGDLGWFAADAMVAPFAAAVQQAEIGVHSADPVQTQFGWHVILVEEVEEQRAPGLEAVRDELVTEVEREKLQAFIRSLRDSAVVVAE